MRSPDKSIAYIRISVSVGEMALHLRTCTTLGGDLPSVVFSTHASCNSSSRISNALFWTCTDMHITYT